MAQEDERTALDKERHEILERIERNLELPMAVLGLVWLLLLVIELTRGLTPLLADLGTVIWAMFVAEFLLRFALASQKSAYLRANWLTALSLLAPALRATRIFRAYRAVKAVTATRSLRLLRLLSGINRTMHTLGNTLRRRGFGYVLTLTLVVLIAGAAGMYAFEQNPGGRGLNDYGTALWWTAMVLTTMGSEYWPRTAEGRLLCLFLAVYGFTMFGYVTATLATYFVARDQEDTEDRSQRRTIESLRAELQALRESPPSRP